MTAQPDDAGARVAETIRRIKARHYPAAILGGQCAADSKAWPCDEWLVFDALQQAEAERDARVREIADEAPEFDEPLGPPTTHAELAAAFQERISHAEFSRFVQEAREQRERAERAEAALARLADWALDAGGWRLFYYATEPPPGIFDLTDRINPDLVPEIKQRLAASQPAAREGGE